jgi:hypothetical protein
MIASGKRDREDLGLASTEDLGHEPGAQRLRVAEEFGEYQASALVTSCLGHCIRNNIGRELAILMRSQKLQWLSMCAILQSAPF